MIEGPFCFFQTVSLGTPVNKGKKKGQGYYTPVLVRYVALPLEGVTHHSRCHTLEECCLRS
jgi:hypothetical protein